VDATWVSVKGVNDVSRLVQIPEDLIRFLFNFDQGTKIQAYCGHCRTMTEQVSVSYSQLPPLHRHELEKVAGRFLDMVPVSRLFFGRPTYCSCGTVNRN
jgi:hypothetical protein